jgi:hypothetical protein
MTEKIGERVHEFAFTAEEQAVAQRIRKLGFEPAVLKVEGDRYSCHPRFLGERNMNEDPPPARIGDSILEVLKLTRDQLEGFRAT